LSGPLFYYTARSSEGALVRGSIEAPNDVNALASLRTRALFVTSLERADSTRGTVAAFLHVVPVKRSALVAFFRSFATLLAAGVPMRRSLEVTIEQAADERLAEALRAVVNDIESGLALSAALARHPREFARTYVAMIRAGEVGGVLDDVLERLASFLERDRSLRKRVSASLAYPAVVTVTACGLVLFLLTSIVPTFQSLYDQMHVGLPPITSFMIRLAAIVRNPIVWVLFVSGVLVAWTLYGRARTTLEGAYAVDNARLHLPVIGSIVRKAIVARLARVLGTLLRAGVGLLQALDVVADVVGNAIYERDLIAVREALAQGDALATPLARTGLYEPLFVQMVRVGEETGTLDTMLLRVADYYETDVETALSALSSVIEPITIVVLGGIVGCIVAAVFIPLYTLIGNIK
jgi:type IV pilus assembly protein PilC